MTISKKQIKRWGRFASQRFRELKMIAKGFGPGVLHAKKTCAPFCAVSCVQQVAMLDNLRAPQVREDSLPLGQPEYEG